MRFSSLVEDGIKNIYANDWKSQEKFLDIIANDVRGMDSKVLKEAKAFFVPNATYILEYFGEEASDPSYDLYNYFGDCVWQNYLVFPVYNVAGRIKGLVGFDAIMKVKHKETGEVGKSYYRFSNSEVFDRGKYIHFMPGGYEKALNEGYIVLVDGTFDMMSLYSHGINAGSLMGSYLNDQIVFQLRFIDTVYLAEDNDRAGRELFNDLKKRLPNLKYIRRNMFKDVDDLLKSEYSETFVRELKSAISQKVDLSLKFRPRK